MVLNCHDCNVVIKWNASKSSQQCSSYGYLSSMQGLQVNYASKGTHDSADLFEDMTRTIISSQTVSTSSSRSSTASTSSSSSQQRYIRTCCRCFLARSEAMSIYRFIITLCPYCEPLFQSDQYKNRRSKSTKEKPIPSVGSSITEGSYIDHSSRNPRPTSSARTSMTEGSGIVCSSKIHSLLAALVNVCQASG